MKRKLSLLILLVALAGLNSALAQVGIGTGTPKTTLQVEGDPTTTTIADGIQGPTLSLAQLDSKIAAYGTDQDGAIVYIDDISSGSTIAETVNITATGYYWYDASNNTWKSMAKELTTYTVGDFAHGGIVFWVDETGQHGLVCAKFDQGTSIRWYAGTYGNTQAKGDGPYSGKANTEIIIASQVAIGDDGNTYAARICNELQITENGITYGDWYLPSKEELNLMYINRLIINATAIVNGGSAFGNGHWSSTEVSSDKAWLQSFAAGVQVTLDKNITSDNIRAIREF
jgi:hypothetical protein